MKPYHARFVVCLALLCTVVRLTAAAEEGVPIAILPASGVQLQCRVLADGTLDIVTEGTKPHVFTAPLSRKLPPDHTVLAFDFFCPKGLDSLRIWFGPKFAKERAKLVRRPGTAEGWTSYSINLGEEMASWGEPGDTLRLDLGNRSGVELQIRNPRLRPMTSRETELAAGREAGKARDARLHEQLGRYLSADYPAKIDEVSVGATTISIRGRGDKGDNLILGEVPPSMDVTDVKFETETPVSGREFSVKLERFVSRHGVQYDRLLSKWVLARRSEAGSELVSHARYADRIEPVQNLPEQRPTSRKGLGGFSTARGHVADLDELDITSATVNIWISRFMHASPAPNRIEHHYQGRSYYFDRKTVESFDDTFRATATRRIVVAAILLVSKVEDSADPVIGRLLQHPDTDPAGIYAMPNMTTPESVHCYAAALDFLASRYSRTDGAYGRIHHWIIHNEVDAGWVWTNMGEKTDRVFMDTYLKSMRMCYHIARTYDAHAEVFITLTHYWAWTSDPKFYPSRDLLDILLVYTRAEGDFRWAVAHHPYPESLVEPKSWLDQKVQFTHDTPLITFKNLEVLDDWIKRPDTQYLGRIKRTLWLSENGTNSRTYSEKDLTEQSAGFAYAWKKMRRLDGIDGFQWHNWFDGRREGGLRIGLRRYSDDETDPGGRKPVWFVFQAAGTQREDEVFDPYKKMIGIEDWDHLNFIGPIDRAKRQSTSRDIQSDTWVATDALGRKVAGADACGPLKDGRFVGMFYFMTHTKSGGAGPFDVTKIVAADPKNPKWGQGAHFWGEPDIGYYLSNDPWVLRRHARQLADAGVDVVIFDVTNNRTFPEVYLPICEQWRRMRAEGERTPDIAFLGSEISVNTLWQEFYKKGMYPDLWFYWKGKPLLLYGQHETPSRKKINDIVFEADILKFFNLRQSWAWTSLPWYNDGRDEWPWVDHFPQTIGWHQDSKRAEQVPVAVAQHPLSNIGRSFHKFHQPATDAYDLTPLTGHGLHFQEQWGRALEVDPEFVFVTGWNEWSAGRQIMGENVVPDLLKWSFYPGAHLGRVGKPIKTGETYFIDQYNQEYSRDIEPMKGGHTDNYYYQLVDNVRKYKGARPPAESGQPVAINIDGGFDQWAGVTCRYFDHVGDTLHRDSPGVGQAGPYRDKSGRNDIVETRVARDASHISFYVKTNAGLTPHSDARWMHLLIDADQDARTGWNGYDYLVNERAVSERSTTLKAWVSGRWKEIGQVPMRYAGQELMLQIPRKNIGEETAIFDFHWADNASSSTDLSDFLLSGDHAPEGRFNYRYNSAAATTPLPPAPAKNAQVNPSNSTLPPALGR